MLLSNPWGQGAPMAYPAHSLTARRLPTPPLLGDALDLYAKRTACNILTDSGFTAAEWLVTISNPQVVEDGTTFDFVQVSIDRNPAAINCIVCYDNIFMSVTSFAARAVFGFQGVCDNS